MTDSPRALFELRQEALETRLERYGRRRESHRQAGKYALTGHYRHAQAEFLDQPARARGHRVALCLDLREYALQVGARRARQAVLLLAGARQDVDERVAL